MTGILRVPGLLTPGYRMTIMKLPKRIADILNQKQAFIDAQRNRLENTVVKLQSQLYGDIISDLISELDVVDGIIVDSAKNFRLLSVLDKTYKDFQITSSKIVLGMVIATTVQIAERSNSYFSEMEEVVPDKAKKLTDLQLGISNGELVAGGYLLSFFRSNQLSTSLKDMTAKAITSNSPVKGYTKDLKRMVTGGIKQGGLEKQYQNFYDIYQHYDAAYNLTVGNQFGYKYFIYQGGLILDSRDFCAAHNDKVWSRIESDSWPTWVPADGEYPSGYEVKQKSMYAVPSYIGYAGYDPLINRGGYNCRHSLGWIPDELAFKLRPSLKLT